MKFKIFTLFWMEFRFLNTAQTWLSTNCIYMELFTSFFFVTCVLSCHQSFLSFPIMSGTNSLCCIPIQYHAHYRAEQRETERITQITFSPLKLLLIFSGRIILFLLYYQSNFLYLTSRTCFVIFYFFVGKSFPILLCILFLMYVSPVFSTEPSTSWCLLMFY